MWKFHPPVSLRYREASRAVQRSKGNTTSIKTLHHDNTSDTFKAMRSNFATEWKAFTIAVLSHKHGHDRSLSIRFPHKSIYSTHCSVTEDMYVKGSSGKAKYRQTDRQTERNRSLSGMQTTPSRFTLRSTALTHNINCIERPKQMLKKKTPQQDCLPHNRSLRPDGVCTVIHFVLRESVQSLCPERVCTISHFVLRESVQSLCPERVCTISHFVLRESVQSLCPERVCTISHFVLRESVQSLCPERVCTVTLS